MNRSLSTPQVGMIFSGCGQRLLAIYRINLIRKKPVDRLGLTSATQDVGMH
jgi:hypothetical protein